MSGRTPNLDKLAAEGMLFTDYYAEASCTAGRAAFITGEIPLRTGLTTVGQAGADVGMPEKAATIATALKEQGYATGQFGKNHLGDLNKYPANAARLRRVLRLPVSSRRDVRSLLVLVPERSVVSRQSRAAQPGPQRLRRTRTTRPSSRVGARSASRGSSTRVRWRRTPTCPTCRTCTTSRPRPSTTWERSTRCWSRLRRDFMDKAKKDGKPFFVWHNTTRMHVWTFLVAQVSRR